MEQHPNFDLNGGAFKWVDDAHLRRIRSSICIINDYLDEAADGPIGSPAAHLAVEALTSTNHLVTALLEDPGYRANLQERGLDERLNDLRDRLASTQSALKASIAESRIIFSHIEFDWRPISAVQAPHHGSNRKKPEIATTEIQFQQTPTTISLKFLRGFARFCGKENRKHVEIINRDLENEILEMQREGFSKNYITAVIVWHVSAGTIVPICWDSVCRFIGKIFPIAQIIRRIVGH